MSNLLSGTAASVPYIASPPVVPTRDSAPVVIAWHLQSPPMTPEAFAAAIPLHGLDAWRIYLTLPLSGGRLPEGGMEAVFKLGMEDAVRKLQVPIIEQATQEFTAVHDALRSELGFGDTKLGLMGGSIGSAVAGRVALDLLQQSDTRLAALVQISPVSRLAAAIEAVARSLDFTYPWDEESHALVQPGDFIARASEFGELPVRLIVGSEDDEEGFVKPAKELADVLNNGDLEIIEGMPHVLVDDDGVVPAPQNRCAKQVDAAAVEWFSMHLGGA